MSIIPVLFFALIALFGLGGTTTSSFSEEVTPAPPVAASASPVVPGTAASAQMPAKLVRSMFKYREELPSCGTIELDSRGPDAWSCLQDAADSGTGAELTHELQTPEGDPIRVYLRVSHGQLEIFTDNSQDQVSGDPAWTYQSCLIPDDVRQECAGS